MIADAGQVIARELGAGESLLWSGQPRQVGTAESGFIPCRRALRNLGIRTERNLESRAKDARWVRTLTLILSLAGRGEDLITALPCREKRRKSGHFQISLMS